MYKKDTKDIQKNQRIQVFARCRPPSQLEKRNNSPSVVEVVNKKDAKEFSVKDGKMVNKSFVFDRVFGPDTKQISVYQAVVGPLIQEVLMGYNCTVFAYGQTGTGKTYTMEGERSNVSCSWEEDPGAGIIPRSLHQLFEELMKDENVEFSVHVSFLELYNEELFDLLSPQSHMPKLRLFEDCAKKGSVIIQGLEEIKVNTKDEVYSILEKGTARRQKATTELNAASSRSHTVFSVTVHIKENTIEGEELLKTGKLNLVDLAGSENIGRSGATQKTAREAGNINQSLLTLGRVITALVEKAPHIPYRESKLTRLLQDSLGGHTKTSLIATVSPAGCNIDETLSTLEYANRAKYITIKPEINQKMTKRALIKEYTEEIERLRKELVAARGENGYYVDHDHYSQMQQDIISKQIRIEDLIERIEALTAEKDKTEALFSSTKEKLDETTAQLNHTSELYNKTSNELTKTERKLVCTQKVLSKTTLQRDENRFLVDTQKKTEQVLSEQAQTLLSVADQSTHDVHALHDKVARKAKVEISNCSKAQEFKVTFQNKVSIFCDGLIKNGQDHVNSLTSIHSGLGSTLEMWNNQKAENALFLDKLIGTFSQHLDELLKCVSADDNDLIESRKGDVEVSLALKECQKALQQKFLASCEILKQNFVSSEADYEKSMLNMHNQLTCHLEQTKDIVRCKVQQQNKELKALSEMVCAHSAHQLAMLQKYKFSLAKQMELQKSILESGKALLKESEDMDSFISDDCVQTEDNISNLNLKICSLINDNTDVQVISSIASIENSQKACFKEVQDASETSTQHVTKLFEAASTYPTEIESIDEDYLKNFQQRKMIEVEKISCDLQKYCQNINEYKAFHGTLVRDHSSFLEERDLEYHQCAESSLETTASCKGHIMGQAKIVKMNETTMNRDIETFVFKDLEKDIPTGTTPQRRDYSYPQSLACTSPYERIVQRFRSQVVPLPKDAFELPLGSSSDEEDLNKDDLDKENEVNFKSSKLPKKIISQNVQSHRRPLCSSND